MLEGIVYLIEKNVITLVIKKVRHPKPGFPRVYCKAVTTLKEVLIQIVVWRILFYPVHKTCISSFLIVRVNYCVHDWQTEIKVKFSVSAY